MFIRTYLLTMIWGYSAHRGNNVGRRRFPRRDWLHDVLNPPVNMYTQLYQCHSIGCGGLHMLNKFPRSLNHRYDKSASRLREIANWSRIGIYINRYLKFQLISIELGLAFVTNQLIISLMCGEARECNTTAGYQTGCEYQSQNGHSELGWIKVSRAQ